MKKQELKQILKPLIKECIKEVIFEEGTLSTIIKEVVEGTSTVTLSENNKKPNHTKINNKSNEVDKLYERKKQILGAIGADAYNGVDIFEGTTPIEKQSSHSPMSGQNPKDPGVDISSFMRPTSEWKKLAGN